MLAVHRKVSEHPNTGTRTLKVSEHPNTGTRTPREHRHQNPLKAAKIVALHAGLNKAMGSRENHVEGGDPTISMLINLLKANDRLYRDFALDRIQRERLRDQRLLDVLEAQVLEYVSRAPVAKLEWREKQMRRNIKVLGLSGDAKYRPTMDVVLASKVDEGAKKQAQVAASLLTTSPVAPNN